MKFGIAASLLIASTLMFGCSGIKTPKAKLADHDARRDIPAIDHMIVSMKKDYIRNCYLPVAHKEPPENSCQTELFQMLERRYHANYNQGHVDMAANDLFFKDIAKELNKMARTDPEVREAIRSGAFRSADEMLAYYKEAYKFYTEN